jgi:hypothetical protein
MKKIMTTNLLVLSMILAFVSAQSQQKASQRPVSSVMNEIKQQQAMRAKMLQQIRLATPSNNASQNGNIQLQPGTASAPQAATQQRSQSVPKTNEKPVINRQQVQIKKE